MVYTIMDHKNDIKNVPNSSGTMICQQACMTCYLIFIGLYSHQQQLRANQCARIHSYCKMLFIPALIMMVVKCLGNPVASTLAADPKIQHFPHGWHFITIQATAPPLPLPRKPGNHDTYSTV